MVNLMESLLRCPKENILKEKKIQPENVREIPEISRKTHGVRHWGKVEP